MRRCARRRGRSGALASGADPAARASPTRPQALTATTLPPHAGRFSPVKRPVDRAADAILDQSTGSGREPGRNRSLAALVGIRRQQNDGEFRGEAWRRCTPTRRKRREGLARRLLGIASHDRSVRRYRNADRMAEKRRPSYLTAHPSPCSRWRERARAAAGLASRAHHLDRHGPDRRDSQRVQGSVRCAPDRSVRRARDRSARLRVPVCGHLHINAETLLVEILDAERQAQRARYRRAASS